MDTYTASLPFEISQGSLNTLIKTHSGYETSPGLALLDVVASLVEQDREHGNRDSDTSSSGSLTPPTSHLAYHATDSSDYGSPQSSDVTWMSANNSGLMNNRCHLSPILGRTTRGQCDTPSSLGNAKRGLPYAGRRPTRAAEATSSTTRVTRQASRKIAAAEKRYAHSALARVQDSMKRKHAKDTELPTIMDYVLDLQSPFIDIDSEETLAEISLRSQLWTRTCHKLYSGSRHTTHKMDAASGCPVSLDAYWSDQAVILEWFGLFNHTKHPAKTSLPVSTERSTVGWAG